MTVPALYVVARTKSVFVLKKLILRPAISLVWCILSVGESGGYLVSVKVVDIYLARLRVSVNIHHYSPPLLLTIVFATRKFEYIMVYCDHTKLGMPVT